MALRSKWCIFKVAIRWLLIVICWSIGYLVFHQATQSLSSSIQPERINRELLSSDVETTKYATFKKAFTTKVSTLPTSTVSEKNPYEDLRVAPDIKINDMQLIKNWASNIPNLPMQYHRSAISYKSSKCANYPKLIDIKIHNGIWQEWTSKLSGATFYIFGAYWDSRKNPVVHLLVMVDRVNPPDVICQFWYGVKGDNTPSAVEPTTTPSYSYIWNSKWGNYQDGLLQPYLLTCPLTSRKDAPLSVSIVDKPCDNATNNVLVVVGKEKKKSAEKAKSSKLKFAVCVKGLNFYFEDMSVRLIEWFELLRALGADKVYVYNLAIHPNVTKVLTYYEDQNFVHVSPLTLPGNRLNEKSLMNFYFKHNKIFKRQAELIPYNDCFYRHRHEYDYMVLLDIDEIIVPLKDNTWSELLHRLTNSTIDSFYASNVYFFDDSVHSHGWDKDVPPYMHMMQHIWRARNHTKPGTYVKSFFNTQSVLTLHNHMPLRCLDGDNSDRLCKTVSIDVNNAQLQHYRKDCDTSISKSCKTLYHKYLVSDDNLRRYIDPVVDRTNIALMSLEFLDNDSINGVNT